MVCENKPLIYMYTATWVRWLHKHIFACLKMVGCRFPFIEHLCHMLFLDLLLHRIWTSFSRQELLSTHAFDYAVLDRPATLPTPQSVLLPIAAKEPAGDLALWNVLRHGNQILYVRINLREPGLGQLSAAFLEHLFPREIRDSSLHSFLGACLLGEFREEIALEVKEVAVTSVRGGSRVVWPLEVKLKDKSLVLWASAVGSKKG